MKRKTDNYRIERLSLPLFTSFLQLLSEFRGEFLRPICENIARIVPAILCRTGLDTRYKFEGSKGASIRLEPPDSSYFLRLCEIQEDSDIQE